MTYTAHLAELSVVVESPIRRRSFRITPQQAEAWARVQEGGRFTQRDLAERTGYSLGGVNRWLTTMRTIGAMRVYTARGRDGVTVLRPVVGARIVSGLRSFAERIREALERVRQVAPENVRDRSLDDLTISTKRDPYVREHSVSAVLGALFRPSTEPVG